MSLYVPCIGAYGSQKVSDSLELELLDGYGMPDVDAWN